MKERKELEERITLKEQEKIGITPVEAVPGVSSGDGKESCNH